ncbi:MAG TPA: DUF4350 domain-containing protein [Gemmatimonadales bacterium]|jgi:hypothetical protein|nr:DUF4350 domain-containing protein [Gemmatimonadales bacterium]
MRPRTSLLLAAAGLVIVAWLAASLGEREARPEDRDLRRSTMLTGPAGARAWAEALELLHVRVTRFRHRPSDLPPPAEGVVVAVLDPAIPLTAIDGLRLAAWQASGGNVLAAGQGSNAYIRCFGLAVQPRYGSAVYLQGDSVRVNFLLVPAEGNESQRTLTDAPTCSAGSYHADTLLALAGGEPVALRVWPDSGGMALLVADGGLFANRAVRETRAGEFTLGLVSGSFTHVIVDEYHQGFGPGGGMLGAAWRWLVSTPAGWAMIQLGIVATIALLLGAIRFGPARRVIERRRRSPLEHVHALATALAAAGGHEVAVSLVVSGLRRRLSHGTSLPHGAARDWLVALPGRTRTAQGRAAAERLITLTHGPADAHSVREAAIAVEDVWQDLTP